MYINSVPRTAAVICEYNPFHSGHKYQIDETRRAHGAQYVAAVMSGSFVQRGDCAVYPKQVRARAALAGGADIVIELPLPWCMAPAEQFALGGAALADALGCADMLSFGSECGDIAAVTKAAEMLDDERVYERSRELQKDGVTFASAREQAVRELGGEAAAETLRRPNDTLGVEYIRALRRIGSGIEPVCVKRQGAEHDGEAADEDAFSSASALRAEIKRSGCPLPEGAARYIPEECRGIYSSAPVADISRLDRVLLARLRLMDRADLAALPDVSEGLENRIYDCAASAGSFEELCAAVKCKRYTLARIRRVVLSVLLDIPAELAKSAPPYIRVLGMSAQGEELIRRLRPRLPLVMTYADAERLGGAAREVYELNRRACEIYSLCFETPLPRGCDFAGGVIKINNK